MPPDRSGLAVVALVVVILVGLTVAAVLFVTAQVWK